MKPKNASMSTPQLHYANDLDTRSPEAIPMVSVIVPNYNHARFLPERLSSICSQTFQDYELIVLDDASSDESLAMIRSELAGLRFQLIINERNSGSPCSQWLKGIRHANGRYVWIAESDDSCTPAFLANMVALMNQGACLAYCRSFPIDERSKPIRDILYWPDYFDAHQWKSSFSASSFRFCQSRLVNANVIPNASAVVFRRYTARTCLSLAPLLQELKFTGDWLFWLEYLAGSNGIISFSCQEDSLFRYHPGTTRFESSLRDKELLHIHEYCRAVSHISRHRLLRKQTKLFTRALDSGWDWMYLEYLYRVKPSYHEVLSAEDLYGPLATLLPIRLALSRHLRSQYFPALRRWHNGMANWWQTSKAMLLASIKSVLS